MTKLNQLLAIEKGVKSRTYDLETEIDRQLSTLALTRGLTRTYKKKFDDDDDLPAESTLVQVKVGDKLRELADVLERAWDVTATKEAANTAALADIVLEDGTMLAEQVPVTCLLFLEKQLGDVRTLVSRLPVLDPQFEWDFDPNANVYRTKPQTTHRTKKVPKPIVKYDATPEHPAQTEMFTEDVIVGFWEATHLSGAIPAQERAAMLTRVEELQRAVKMAREAANDRTVNDVNIASKLLAHVFPAKVSH